jgi:hypothetical protein
MAWYNNASDLKKKVTPTKQSVGNAYSIAVKQPIQATYESIKTGSAQPLKEYGGNVWSQAVKKPIQQLGEATGITPNESGGSSSGAPASEPFAFKSKLQLTDLAGEDALTKDFSSMIGQNESADTNIQNVRNQYAAMGSLAKLREGATAQSEQNAIQRRLASTGMGSSGAGLRMQNLAAQQSGRRGAETQLGIAAEQAGKEIAVSDATNVRNLQRENMRMGGAESAAGRKFAVETEKRRGEQAAAQFELDKEISLANQATARDIQRYNERGLFGQLFGDLLGGGAIGGGISMRKPLG